MFPNNTYTEVTDMNFKELAKSIQPQLVEWRRDFHMHPEVSFHEFRTSQVIKDFLKSEGIEILPVDSGTSVVGLIRGGKEEDKQ